MTDRLLAAQQNTPLELGQSFDYYFPYEAIDHRTKERKDSPFVTFLRFSLFRPRDIVCMLKNLQDNFIVQRRGEKELFREKDFDSPVFRRKHSEYLLTQIKDHLSFYHSSADYELFLKFFEYLNGNFGFTYAQFIVSYGELVRYLEENSIKKPMFFETPDKFLQFLFDMNVICYIEDSIKGPYINWCFRERSYANLFPKVKLGLRYEIHYGLGKALNVGQSFLK